MTMPVEFLGVDVARDWIDAPMDEKFAIEDSMFCQSQPKTPVWLGGGGSTGASDVRT